MWFFSPHWIASHDRCPAITWGISHLPQNNGHSPQSTCIALIG